MGNSFVDWLKQAFHQRHALVTIYDRRIKQDGLYYSIPIHVESVPTEDAEEPDAYDIASILQEVEDAWNLQDPQPKERLLLIPAGK